MTGENDITVRFLREGQIERAHPKDARKGGFWIERIPPGTVKRMKRRSVDFWRRKEGPGFLEIVTAPVSPVAPVPLTAPVPPIDPRQIDWLEERKTELRLAIDAALSGAGALDSVLALDPGSLPGVNPADVEGLSDPFQASIALRAIRQLVRARPGRRPRNAS
jgi:hypothetical protein